jgi:hypothetical protein
MSRKKFYNLNSFSFAECWERIKSKTPIENYSQLAEIIGLSKSNITKRKEEDLFPIEWAFHVGQKFNLSTEWILKGKETSQSEGDGMNPLLTDVNDWLNEEEKHKDAEFRILFRQQMIRAFFDYENWVKKRQVPMGSGESGSARKVA